MSIPQPQMLYTGMNVAVPDWKSFNKDFNARMDMIRREKQQERQFEIQRQDQLNREFLRQVNIDDINYTDAQFQQAAADIYTTTYDALSGITENTRGNLGTTDIMKGKAVANRAMQKLTSLKQWETNRRKDITAALDPEQAGKFTKESKEEAFNYKIEDGPYNESKLELAKWSPDKTAQKLRAEFKDGNKASAIIKAAGYGDISGDTEDERKVSYLSKFYDEKLNEKGQKYLELDRKAAIDNVKTLLGSSDMTLGRLGVMEAFDNEVKEKDKERYRIASQQATGNEKDAAYAWFIDEYAEDLFPNKIDEYKERDTSNQGFNLMFGGQKVKDNLTQATEQTYGSKQMNNFYPLGDVNVKLTKGQPVKGAKVVNDNGELIDAKRSTFDDAVIAGINVEDGYATDVVLSVPSMKLATNSKGEKLYKYGSGMSKMVGTLDYFKREFNLSEEDLDREREQGERQEVIIPAWGNEHVWKGKVAVNGQIPPSRKPESSFNYDQVNYKKLNKDDKAALEWVKKNEDDPRAEAIYQELTRR